MLRLQELMRRHRFAVHLDVRSYFPSIDREILRRLLARRIRDDRFLAGIGAHIAHLLRDMSQDTADGFINIPREYLEAHGIGPEDMQSPPYRAWVRGRVELARQYLCEGKRYLDRLDVLRCKIVGYWYCARFEGVLDAIEHDGYVLRPAYNER